MMNVCQVCADLLLIVTCISCWCSCEARGKELNIGELDDVERPFRMKKTNMIWNKARQRLHGKKLVEAYADLEMHDKREAELKKLLADGLDEYGVMAGKVLKSYKRLMELYDLDASYKYTKNRAGNEIDDDYFEKEVFFQDAKLQSMWQQAQDSGFSADDLRMLREEFQHQQMKLDEFNYIHGESKDMKSDNDVEDKKMQKAKKADEKNNKQDIHEGYIRLEQLSRTLPISEPDFMDNRVGKMWNLAMKTNWTSEELDSFKEELSHLDHKLNKQAQYSEKVQDSLKKFNKISSMPDQHKHIHNAAALLNKKVDKISKELKNRLDKALRHVEL